VVTDFPVAVWQKHAQTGM